MNRVTISAWFTSQCSWEIMNVKVLCKWWCSIQHEEQWWCWFWQSKMLHNSGERERSQPRIPLFHLMDSSGNTEAVTRCCPFPDGLGEQMFTKYREGRWAMGTPSPFCPWSPAELHLQGRLLVWEQPSSLHSASALLLLLWNAPQSDVQLLWLMIHPWENAQRMWTALRQLTGSWTRKCRVTMHPSSSTQILSPQHTFSEQVSTMWHLRMT